VEPGAPEEQMAMNQRGNSTQEDSLKNKQLNRETSDTLAYNIKCKWENQAKKAL
jgi:hypothetical protein